MARSYGSALLRGAGWLALGVAACLAAGWLLLHVPAVERRIARLAAGRVSEAIAGDLALERLGLRGLGGAVLRGVELRTPDGEKVASARRVEVRVALADLLRDRSRVVVDVLRVEGLALELAPGEDGELGIARALAAAQPEPEPEPDGGAEGSTEVILRDVRVELDSLVQRPSPGAPPALALERGVLEGRVHVGPGGAVEAELGVAADALAPVRGPLRVDVAATLADGRLSVERLAAALPGAIDVEAAPAADAGGGGGDEPPGVAPEAAGTLPIEVAPLRLAVALPADGLVPWGGPRLPGPVRLEARAAAQDGRVSLDADVAPPGPGSARVRGWLAPGEPSRFAAEVRLRGVDPARLAAGAPAGRVSADVSASGRLGEGGPRITGRLALHPSRLGREAIGPGGGRFRLSGGRVAADHVSLALPGGAVRGSVALGGGAPLELDVTADLPRLDRLRGALVAAGIEVPPLAGAVRARARLAGGGRDRRLAVEVRAPEVTVGEDRFEEIALDARARGRELEGALRAVTPEGPVELSLRGVRRSEREVRLEGLSLTLLERTLRQRGGARVAWRGGRIVVDGLALSGEGLGRLALDADVPWPLDAGALRADVRVEDVPVEALRPLVPERVADGVLALDARVRGTLRAPRVEGRASARLALEPDGDEASLALEAQVSRARAAVRGEVVLPGAEPARIDVALDAPRGRAVWSRAGALGARIAAELRAPGIDLGTLARLGLLPADVRGTARADLRASGRVSTVDLSGDLSVTQLVLEDPDVGRLPPLGLALRVDATRGSVDVSGALSADGAPEASFAARVAQSLPELLSAERRRSVPLSARLEVEPGRLELPRLGVLAEALAVDARASGTLDALRVDAGVRGDGVFVEGVPLGEVRAGVAIRPGARTADLRFVPPGGGSLRAELSAPPGAPWTARVVADGARLDFLRALPQVRAAEDALLDADLAVTGAPELRAEGRLSARARRLTIAGVGALRDLELDLGASGTAVEVRRAAVRIADGSASLAGNLEWGGGEGAVDLVLDAKRLPVPDPARPAATLTTRATLRGTLEGDRLDGSLELSEGEIRLPEGSGGDLHPSALPPDYVVYRDGERQGDAPSSSEPWLAAKSARVRVEVPRNFWIRGEQGDLELASTLTATWEDGQAALDGRVEVIRGTVTVLRQRFDVERLALDFTGRRVEDPTLDARLVLEEPEVKVFVDVRGSVAEPTIELTSDPPMDQAQIALLIATGRGGGGDAGLQGAAVAGALNMVAGPLTEAVTETLPLDVLSVEVGPGGEARMLEAGSYVTEDLFVSFVRNLFAGPGENVNEVQAEYQLGRSVSIESRIGDEQTGVNLTWERRFRSEAQRRAGAVREGPAPGPAPGAPSAALP